MASSFLLFLLIGPIGRNNKNELVWMTRNLGIFGYAAFSGVQQLIVITGLHHVFGAIESQLLLFVVQLFYRCRMICCIHDAEGYVKIKKDVVVNTVPKKE